MNNKLFQMFLELLDVYMEPAYGYRILGTTSMTSRASLTVIYIVKEYNPDGSSDTYPLTFTVASENARKNRDMVSIPVNTGSGNYGFTVRNDNCAECLNSDGLDEEDRQNSMKKYSEILSRYDDYILF